MNTTKRWESLFIAACLWVVWRQVLRVARQLGDWFSVSLGDPGTGPTRPQVVWGLVRRAPGWSRDGFGASPAVWGPVPPAAPQSPSRPPPLSLFFAFAR